MTEKQFIRVQKEAMRIARDCTSDDFKALAFQRLEGFGLREVKCMATLQEAAFVYNWQCLTFSMEYDELAVEETRRGYIANVIII